MKNERFHNSRISDCLRRSLCFFCCFVLCLCIIPPDISFASSSVYSSTITYSRNGIQKLPSDQVNSGYYPLIADSNKYLTFWKQGSSVPESPIYAFRVNNAICVAVPIYNPNNGFYYFSIQTPDSLYTNVQIDNTNCTTDTDRNLMYFYNGTLGNNYTYTDILPVFSTLDAGLDAIVNGGSSLPNDGFDGSLIVPAGNVAYVQINGGDMELTAVMNSKSGLIMGGNPWANNARISYGVSDYPSSGTSFPLSGSTLIPWMKQAEGQDLLGRTRYAGYPRSGLSTSDNFIVIYNPACSSLASKGFNEGEDELNPSITAHFSKLVTYRIYPLTQSYNVQTNELTSESISDYNDYFNGTPDENGQFTETPSSPGMPSQAQPGGTGGLSDSSQSIGDYIRNITNILSNFVNNVIALIQVPISHIGQLIDSGSGFMSALRGLYAWLPVDIQGLVISALTVVIGIGVFKVFL